MCCLGYEAEREVRELVLDQLDSLLLLLSKALERRDSSCRSFTHAAREGRSVRATGERDESVRATGEREGRSVRATGEG